MCPWLVKSSPSNFNLRSPDCYLVRIYLIATVNISFRDSFRELCTTLLRLWGKFRLDKHSCFDKQIRVLIQKICHPIVSNNTRRVISAVQKWGKFFNFEKKMCGDQHTYRVQCKKMLHTWHILALLFPVNCFPHSTVCLLQNDAVTPSTNCLSW